MIKSGSRDLMNEKDLRLQEGMMNAQKNVVVPENMHLPFEDKNYIKKSRVDPKQLKQAIAEDMKTIKMLNPEIIPAVFYGGLLKGVFNGVWRMSIILLTLCYVISDKGAIFSPCLLIQALPLYS
ncbi:hypothetical protein PGH45_20190 [Legionella pneumophila]|nr:hypothetical protein [Legionella pneumophila]